MSFAVPIPPALKCKFPLNQYTIVPRFHRDRGPVYFVQSHVGTVVDDFGQWVNAKGELLQPAGYMIPSARLSTKMVQDLQEWNEAIV